MSEKKVKNVQRKSAKFCERKSTKNCRKKSANWLTILAKVTVKVARIAQIQDKISRHTRPVDKSS